MSTPPTFTLTLTAREGTIPLTIRNDSGVPLHVSIRLSSPKLEFPDGDTIDRELVEESTRIDIRVRSRATGAFPLRIDVRTPDGRQSLSMSRYTVRSTAVSGAGLRAVGRCRRVPHRVVGAPLASHPPEQEAHRRQRPPAPQRALSVGMAASARTRRN